MKNTILFLSLIFCVSVFAENKRMAMIKDGVVQGVAVWDGVSPWEPEGNPELVELPSDSKVGPDWIYDGKNFSAPSLKNEKTPEQQKIDELEQRLKAVESGGK